MQAKLLSRLQTCTRENDVPAGRQLHSLLLLQGLATVAILSDYLLRLYAFSGSLFEANLVFCQTSHHSVYTWYGIISAYITHQNELTALSLYQDMLQMEVMPNNYILSCILKSCCSEGRVADLGVLLHHHAVVFGLASDVVVGSSLINAHAKRGLLKEARYVFDNLPDRNVVSYGAMIAGYAQNGYGLPAFELYDQMRCNGIKPNRVIFFCILSACSVLAAASEGRRIHDSVVRYGMESDLAVGNTLVDMYAKCGSIEEAHNLFAILTNRNIVSWGAMITGYAQQQHSFAALKLFQEMQQNDVPPNRVIYLSVLKACSIAGAIDLGEEIHEQIKMNHLESDLAISSSLIDMHAKFGNVHKAENVFNDSPDKNVVLSSVMLSGYVQNGLDILALQLFEKMENFDIMPDTYIFTCVLKACANARALLETQLIHCSIIKASLERDVAVGSSLVDAYSKCGCLEEACTVFEKLPERNEVTWGAMLTGYNQHEKGFLALDLFQKMLRDGVNPDKVRILNVLKACGSIGALWQGKMIHDLIKKNKLHIDVVLGNALIDMYAKSGDLEGAYTVFNDLRDRDIVSWGAMIAGYAQEGHHDTVRQLLRVMQHEGFTPNDRIYSSILSACSHAGLVKEGYYYYKSMTQDYGILPSYEHMNCMVDILSRAGFLSEARKLLQRSMPCTSDNMAWTALLTACRTYGNLQLGKECYKAVLQ